MSGRSVVGEIPARSCRERMGRGAILMLDHEFAGEDVEDMAFRTQLSAR